MKIFRKISVLLMAIICFSVLASCSNNTSVPYGSIDDSVYASNGSYSVTKKQLYDSIRVEGYSTVYEKIKHALVADELALVDYSNNADDKIYIDELVSSACYSTVDSDALTDLTAEEITTKKAQFIDSMASKGYTITADELAFSINDEQISFDNLSSTLINYYKPERAYWLASKAYLETIVDSETVKDVNGDDIDNTYYITDVKLKAKYNNSYKEYSDTRAIIIRFNSLKDANAACDYINTNFGTITPENSLEYFVRLYNYYYSYRSDLTTTNVFESDSTLFETDAEHSELANIGSVFNTFYTNTLEDYTATPEASYTAIPRSLDNNRYTMVLRLDTEYLNGTSSTVAYDDLDTLGETKKAEILSLLRNELLESYISSSFYTTLFEVRMRDADISIYDPLFEAQFYKTYGEDYYSLVKKGSSDKIYTITYKGVTSSLMVDDFYNEVEAYNGVPSSLEIMMYDYCLDNFIDEITDDELDSYKDELNTAISDFKDNESTYDKSIGLENFLMLTYGYKTKADVLTYYFKAPALLNFYMKKYYESDYFNADNSINTSTTIFEYFLKYTAIKYASLFTINLDHILISVDDNCDGTVDDPTDFTSDFTADELANFNSAILDLTNAIIAEVNFIKGTDKLSAAKYVKKAFNEGAALQSTDYIGYTWDDFKTSYNFVLTVESLGEVTQDTASSYVDEFSTYIKNVYKNMVADDLLLTTDDDAIFYTIDTDDDSTIDFNELCKTVYGYHILIVNEIETPTAPTFLEEDDSDGEYSQIKITIDEGDDSDDESDDIYFITSAYNSSETNASINQLFIYFYESVNGGVVSLPSDLTTKLDTLFSEVSGYYTNTDFRQYLAILEIENITWTNSLNSDKYTKFLEVQKHKLYNYYDSGVLDGWYDEDWTK